uniref:Metal ABC transporter substrate-binding protein n=1 Tax=Candidatus Aschnera chinzeii TaxID=1485666 RepID=A0AAT9G4N8_9ENTR|nr:MAG: metal ABC transporter substrate-binding protein [Candidatus Aschnera chinzeii]
MSYLYLILFPSYLYAKKFTVITTFTILQDIAQNIAGNTADVYSIIKPGAEIHDYQPTPKDILKAYDADLILWNGLGLETWFQRFFVNLPHIPAVVVTNGVQPIPISGGIYHNNPNPHAWMSIKNALIYIENIKNAFIKYNPINQDIYINNAKIYSTKIRAVDKIMRNKLMKIPKQKRWLVTSEGAFSYLAKDYDFQESYLWPINADEQGTPQQVRKVIEIVKKYNIPVVFSESTISDKPAKQVSKETGASYGGVLYVDSLSIPTGIVPTYIALIKTTINTIVKGFNL